MEFFLTCSLFSQVIDSLKEKLSNVKIPPNSCSIYQVSIDCHQLPLISWLAAQTQFPKIYWKGRDSEQEVAAIGCCKDFYFQDTQDNSQQVSAYQQQQSIATPKGVRYYGGVAFDSEDETWQAFGQAHFVLPQIELRRNQQHFELLVSLNIETGNIAQQIATAISTLEQLQPAIPLPSIDKVALLNRTDQPTQAQWTKLVQQVTHPSAIQQTPKVVLSRLTTLSIEDDINPWTLLACWQGKNSNSFQFGFQFSPDSAFISCTPERLFRRVGRQLSTEALAGTTIRGDNKQTDQQLAQQLLNDNKNSHENRLVMKDIVNALTPLSNTITADETATIFKQSHIQHLHRAISAELNSGVNDLQILHALHPTPAVGGIPKTSALAFIRQNEGYSRGWYAGACGYFNEDESEFAVAIRSALITPKQIKLFAGAGIVTGSEADAEWRELENKLTTILSIISDL